MTEEKSKWVKYGAIFAIIIMIGSAVLVGLSLYGNDSTDPVEYPLKSIKGTQADFTFKNAKDGVKYLPAGILSVEVIKIYPGDVIAESFNNAFPGVTSDKVMVGSYPDGIVEYYAVDENNNGSVIVPGKPRYDEYNGYNVLIMSPAQRVIAGDPLIVASFFNYTLNNTLGKRVADVLAGKSSGATDLNDILAYAEDTDVFDEIRAFKANNGSDYDKYYQCTSQSETGILKIEAIFLSPNEDVKESVSAFANNASDSVTVAVLEDGPALKIYITTSDYIGFLVEMQNLNQLISSHTAQGSSA
jgi:hypothetical protein